MTGPWEDYTPAPDVASMVASEAQRQGVDPDLAVRVANQESRLNHGQVSPAGAIGVMQLMPSTAKDLGVDPTDLNQNIQGGVSYLKQQLDTFKDPRLAAAAYNAGPGAVQKYGGVPPYAETKAYVDAVAPGGSAQPPWMDYGPAPAPAPATGPRVIGASHNGGVTISVGGPDEPSAAPTAPPPRPGPTIAQDAAGGFAQPFLNVGHDIMEGYRKTTARAGQPLPSLPQAAMQAVSDAGDTGKTILDAVGAIPSAITGAFVRPAARAITNYGPTPYSLPQLNMNGGRLGVTAPQALSGDTAQAANEGLINTALQGARPAAGMGLAAAATKPMNLDQAIAAKNAAYQRVDASGFTFPTNDVKTLASDIANEVAAKGGPSGAKLYPAANAMSDRITALANQPGGVPLTQLDSLRSDIYGALVKPGDREAPLGVMMRQKIDGLINGSSAPNIQEARDLNTRVMKMQAVTDKLDSAGLRSASTYSGGNYNNAVRQNLRPLVDPTSAQQIGNLTPAENIALRTAVQGTPVQNATRYATKILTNKMVQAPVAVMTHGAGPAIMEALGTILNKTGEGQTGKAVQKVLDLMSLGGTPAPKIPPVYPTLAVGAQPPIPIWSGRGLIGASALARLPAQTLAARQSAAPRR